MQVLKESFVIRQLITARFPLLIVRITPRVLITFSTSPVPAEMATLVDIAMKISTSVLLPPA